MILVTLGTSKFPFDRLVRWLEHLLSQGAINEAVLLQHGATSVEGFQHPLLKKVFGLSKVEIQEAVAQSSFVLSHAGQGSARMLVAAGSRFIIVPRLARYGEHVDDHQLDFAQAVGRLGVPFCTEFNELLAFLKAPRRIAAKELFSGPFLTDFLIELHSPGKAAHPS